MPILMRAADVAQKLVELFGFARIETRCRLIEAEEQGLGAHGARDLETALRAIGQIAGRIVGTFGQAHLVEPVFAFFDQLLPRRSR